MEWICVRSKDGWPVEMIKGRHVTNFLRRLIHGNLRMTLRGRNSSRSERTT